MEQNNVIVGIYEDPDVLIDAINKIKEKGIKIKKCLLSLSNPRSVRGPGAENTIAIPYFYLWRYRS